MANFNIPQELIDRLATEEVQALLEGLEDEEQRKNPAFLAKVRQFLKDNDFNTTVEIEGVKEVKQEASKIPDFMELVKEG
ncbi:MAG: hypothetical protein ACI4N8_08740 [Megasphaera sp.]|jgi:hypothetical protein|uniref:DNA packaging protein n=1 Tax=virus sp. ctLGd4 TaxID=2826800 RepID=A0A8S5R7N4_9VIRU|nr:hypothetical protein [uncultured Megasphaera sp.]DAE27408.1 MAG TPA: DNA packaging protein [virus sp. ctLGd4]DAF09475.1 MAG TPA: DNA packaging protein [Bacteriophage sp.]DAJ12333.1 MAG TPA: DNA packaging protein [Bacteriophage sp.]DAL64324.1 MAG TPA_asm: DNA packaging protein [Bacteriophage sp.]DAL83356.1 MAG TPA: DNA packaging protein [Bacteriophage sp.]